MTTHASRFYPAEHLRPLVLSLALTAAFPALLAGQGSEPAGQGGAAPETVVAVAEIPGNPFSRSIEAFERQDREMPPAPGGVLFLGSSSIRLWNLEKSFPGVRAVNRGFGGSQISDSVEFAERIVMPHRPRLVVFYAGDNDVNAGKPPERIVSDYRQVVEKIHARLPDTRIAFVAIKPSVSRWKHLETQMKANALVAEFTRSDARLIYVDVVAPMLGADGKPRPELFVKDGLHLSEEGYRVWNAAVAPLLASDSR